MSSNGIGALAELRWSAIYTNDEEKAYKWATAKADTRGESRDAAKAFVAKKMNKDLI